MFLQVTFAKAPKFRIGDSLSAMDGGRIGTPNENVFLNVCELYGLRGVGIPNESEEKKPVQMCGGGGMLIPIY